MRRISTSIPDDILVHSRKMDTARDTTDCRNAKIFPAESGSRRFVVAAKIAALSISLQVERTGRVSAICREIRTTIRRSKGGESRRQSDKGLSTSSETLISD